MIDKIIMVLVIAIGFTIIYAWGYVKQQRKGQELFNELKRKLEEKILKELKKTESLSNREIEILIVGMKASLFWSKDKIKIIDPKIVSLNLINNLLSKGLIIEITRKNHKRYKIN